MRIERKRKVPKIVGIPKSEIDFKERVEWLEKEKKDETLRPKITNVYTLKTH